MPSMTITRSNDGPQAGAFSVVRNGVRAVVTIPPFLVRHAWRNRHVERSSSDVDELSESPPPTSSHPRGQRREDGVGPIVMRTYEIDIFDPRLDATQLIELFRADPNRINSNLVAGFVRDDQPARALQRGDDLVVELPGPWNGPVHVDRANADQVILATLDGHMEAGHIRFDTHQISGNAEVASGYSFRIRSWARAGDVAFAAVHLGVPIGRELQTAMWTAMCDLAVEAAGGRRSGKIRVSTEMLRNSSISPAQLQPRVAK